MAKDDWPTAPDQRQMLSIINKIKNLQSEIDNLKEAHSVTLLSGQYLFFGPLIHDVLIGKDTSYEAGTYLLTSITLTSDIDINQDVSVVRVPAEGEAYSDTLAAYSLEDAKTFKFTPDNDIVLRPGDAIKVKCTNKGNPTANVHSLIVLLRLV